MRKRNENKKGISPMIATVLLIAMVIAIALILFLWFRNMVKEDATKFEGESIEITCGKVNFRVDYLNNELSVVNDGAIPIYSLKIDLYSSDGNKEISRAQDEGLTHGINQGGVYTTTISEGEKGDSTLERIVVYPVLIGNTKEGTRTHVCRKNGVEIIL